MAYPGLAIPMPLPYLPSRLPFGLNAIAEIDSVALRQDEGQQEPDDGDQA